MSDEKLTPEELLLGETMKAARLNGREEAFNDAFCEKHRPIECGPLCQVCGAEQAAREDERRIVLQELCSPTQGGEHDEGQERAETAKDD